MISQQHRKQNAAALCQVPCLCHLHGLCAAEDVLPQLSRSVGAGSVYCYGEVTAEEVKMESAVGRALDKAGAALKVRQDHSPLLSPSLGVAPALTESDALFSPAINVWLPDLGTCWNNHNYVSPCLYEFVCVAQD